MVSRNINHEKKKRKKNAHKARIKASGTVVCNIHHKKKHIVSELMHTRYTTASSTGERYEYQLLSRAPDIAWAGAIRRR